ncbi:MAG: DUF4350 domain-containing protein [Pseudomonadota bacterium]
MTDLKKTLLAFLVVALLVAGGFAAWYAAMEKVWEARRSISPAAIENPLLGATTLLRQNGHPTQVHASLGEVAIPRLPDGTLVMGDASGVTAPATAAQLLAWVRRGNTLVAQPRWSTPVERAFIPNEASEDVVEDEDDEEDEAVTAPAEGGTTVTVVTDDKAIETDPIAARLGVVLYQERPVRDCAAAPAPAATTAAAPAPAKPCAKFKAAPLRRLSLPGSGYWLELNAGYTKMSSTANPAPHLWSDEHGDTVRVFAEGKGRIVMLASDFFSNDELVQRDHAELLLGLAALNPRNRNVTIIQHLDVLPWYAALGENFPMPLAGLACLLALLLWRALRRFGPMVAEPVSERRSLMEHIEASGAWLWKAKGGRQVLLDAAREETLALLRRRVPALLRLAPHDLAEALARAAGLDQQHVTFALQSDALPQVAGFTRQVRTLQELRNHYDR